MIIYFSGSLNCKKVNNINGEFGLLTSYIEQRKKKELKIPNSKKIFLDSGAYSVSTGKAVIDIDEYIEFINKYKSLFEVYANLDVIGNAKLTDRNQKYMESKGLKPLPTFHYGTDYNELNKMIKNYNYIGLGGLVPIAMKRKKMVRHLDNCFRIIKDKVKVHGWGITSRPLLFRYPFYSVDSTSHIKWSAFRWEIYNEGLKMKRKRMMGSENNVLLIKNTKAILQMVDEATNLWNKRGIKYDTIS